jgi:hypothetical protein
MFVSVTEAVSQAIPGTTARIVVLTISLHIFLQETRTNILANHLIYQCEADTTNVLLVVFWNLSAVKTWARMVRLTTEVQSAPLLAVMTIISCFVVLLAK